MSEDTYKIIISISHRRIAFDYWQRDGGNRPMPMPGGNWPAPLAFYVKDNGIEIGEGAVRAARSETDGAFDNYFDLLSSDLCYTIAGQTNPISRLLLDASEERFRQFFSDVMYRRLGAVEDNRSTMPLTIVCEDDILPRERALIKDLFQSAGYVRVAVVEYKSYIARYICESLSKDYACDKVAVAWTEGEDLIFTLFDVKAIDAPLQRCLPGLGVDPRQAMVENRLKEAIKGANPWLKPEDNSEVISDAAADFLNSSLPIKSGELVLSDGFRVCYRLNLRDFDAAQHKDVSIKDCLREFLNTNGVDKLGTALLVLRGVAATNSYFEQNLSHGFLQTIKADKHLRDKVMNLILADDNAATPIASSSARAVSTPRPVVNAPAPADPVKQLKKRWREVKAAARGKLGSNMPQLAHQMLSDFYGECQSVAGATDILVEIKAEMDGISQHVETAREVAKVFDRRWREVRASAKGKAKAGNTAEAAQLLREFAKEVARDGGAPELLSAIEAELATLPKAVTAKPKKETPQESQGQNLLRQGRLKEAREWFKTNGESTKANTLTAIIRQQKTVDIRKSGLAECRRQKNMDQINRIIEELQEFIALCDKVGYPAADYRQLLSEYQNI